MNLLPGQMERAFVDYFTTAANNTEQSFTFVNSADDFRTRHVNQVYVGLATAGITLKIYVESVLVVCLDLSRFANGNDPVYVDFDIPAMIQPVVSLQDAASGAHSNVPVILFYAVDAGSGK